MNAMKKIDNNILLLIHFLMFLLCIVFVSFEVSIQTYQILLIILFFEILILSFKDGTFDLYQIFLITFFLFIISRIFLDVIGVADFRELNLYESNYLGYEDTIILLKVLIIFLLGTSFGWIFSKRKNEEMRLEYFSQNIPQTNIKIVLEGAFYLYLILFIIKLVIMLRLVIVNGYTFFFDGGMETYKFPIYLTGVGTIIDILFIINIFYNRTEKDFKKFSKLYFFSLILRMFSGKRALTLVTLLLILWLWSVYYRKLKLKTIAIVGFISGFMVEFISNLRWHSNNTLGMILSNLLYQLLYGQGGSLLVVANTIRFNSSFQNEVPFFWGYVVDRFRDVGSGQNILKIQNGNYLGDHLTYLINERLFFLGRGTGTSIIAEFYELSNGNLFLIFLLAMLLTYSVIKFSRYMYKSIYRFLISYYLAFYFIFSPRDSIGKSINMIVFGCFIAFFVSRFDIKSTNVSKKDIT